MTGQRCGKKIVGRRRRFHREKTKAVNRLWWPPVFFYTIKRKDFFLGIRSGITLYHDLSTCFPSTTQHLVAFLRGSLSYLPCDDGSSMPLENWRGNGPTSGRRRRRKKKRFIVPVISVSFLRPWRSLSLWSPFFYVPPHSPRDLPFEPADGKLQGNYFSFVFIIVLFLLSSSFFPAWLFPAEISNSALK